MDEKTKKNSHGFTWGMIVGGAVVLMLTTKRGREILKEVTEGGIDGIDQFIDIDKIKALTSEFDDEDIPEDISPISSVDQKPEKHVDSKSFISSHPTQPIKERVVSKKKSPITKAIVEKEIPSTKINSKKPRLFKKKKA
jgi:hypothetical protein